MEIAERFLCMDEYCNLYSSSPIREMIRMAPDEYVLSVVSKYQILTGPQSPAYEAGQQLYPIISKWANNFLLNVSLSGSFAKDTAIKGSADLDLFISLHPQTPGTLKDIYNNLYNYLLKLIFDTSNSLKLQGGKRFFLSKRVF